MTRLGFISAMALVVMAAGKTPGSAATATPMRPPSTQGRAAASSKSMETAISRRKEALAVLGDDVHTPSLAERSSGESGVLKAAPPRGGAVVEAGGLPASVKLLIGAGGIYAAFMYYGLLQEDVFAFQAADGSKFKQAWFLQTLEALANSVVGFVGLKLTGGTPNLPLKMFALSGTSQVSAKAFTSLALAHGLSFPVVTLAKSGKMVPVMIGSILLGSASYSLREYAQVAAIIGGTCMVSMAKKKKASGPSSALGVLFIVASLVMDGLTGGMQKALKVAAAERGLKPKPYDFMFWTNAFMMATAVVVSFALGEFTSGAAFCTANPEILSKIIKFALCSAVGQSFIFYTIANFDPLVCTTVTTTRKIYSVLLSILLKGHKLNAQGWGGIAVACLGILGELEDKYSRSRKH